MVWAKGMAPGKDSVELKFELLVKVMMHLMAEFLVKVMQHLMAELLE